MAEYIGLSGTAAPNTPIVLTTSIACPKGYVIHRDDSGILTLRGITNGCQKFARYLVLYFGNIAIPDGGTLDTTRVGLTISGEPVQSTISMAPTPTAAEEFAAVSSGRFITVPAGCCYNVALENLSSQDILYSNFNVIVTRVA